MGRLCLNFAPRTMLAGSSGALRLNSRACDLCVTIHARFRLLLCNEVSVILRCTKKMGSNVDICAENSYDQANYV
jgi:hypothetical protein